MLIVKRIWTTWHSSLCILEARLIGGGDRSGSCSMVEEVVLEEVVFVGVGDFHFGPNIFWEYPNGPYKKEGGVKGGPYLQK